jgi:diguanylate cyclase (GGDEF)-like protein
MVRALTDIRIGAKIVGVTLVVASIFAGVGVIGVVDIKSLAAQQKRQYTVNVLALSRMTNVRSAVSGQQEAVLSHILADSGFYRDHYADVIVQTDRAIDADVAALHGIPLSAAERQGLRGFVATIAIWRTARDNALVASRSGDREKAASIVLVRSEAVAHAVKARADAFLNQLVEAVAVGAREAQRSSDAAGRLILLLLVLGGGVAVTLSILAARTISRPLRATVEVLARVARGDLDHRLDVTRNDEIGQMGRSLNETLGVLRGAFDQLNHRVSHDGLTGLANRALFHERLRDVRVAASQGAPVAVLLIDLDGFKLINDAYGHAAGDHMLMVIAQRLLEGVREADTVARLGGDEFAVLLDGTDTAGAVHAEEVHAVAERLLASIQLPTVFNGVALFPRASVGVTGWDGELEIDALIHVADVAMYEAKQRGKGKGAAARCETCAELATV